MNWPGPAAFNLFNRVHEQLGPQARTFVEDVIGRSVQIVRKTTCNKYLTFSVEALHNFGETFSH
jgi:DNA-binding transcriptional regulator PaaX